MQDRKDYLQVAESSDRCLKYILPLPQPLRKMKFFQVVLGAVLVAASCFAAAPSEPGPCTKDCFSPNGPKRNNPSPENCDRYNRAFKHGADVLDDSEL